MIYSFKMLNIKHSYHFTNEWFQTRCKSQTTEMIYFCCCVVITHTDIILFIILIILCLHLQRWPFQPWNLTTKWKSQCCWSLSAEVWSVSNYSDAFHSSTQPVLLEELRKNLYNGESKWTSIPLGWMKKSSTCAVKWYTGKYILINTLCEGKNEVPAHLWKLTCSGRKWHVPIKSAHWQENRWLEILLLSVISTLELCSEMLVFLGGGFRMYVFHSCTWFTDYLL